MYRFQLTKKLHTNFNSPYKKQQQQKKKNKNNYCSESFEK